MKKIVTAFTACAFAAMLVFSFAACGVKEEVIVKEEDSINEEVIVKTVTKSEWEKAFYEINVEAVDELSLYNFTVSAKTSETYEGYKKEGIDSYVFDYKNKAVRMIGKSVENHNGQVEESVNDTYIWEVKDGVSISFSKTNDNTNITLFECDFYKDVYAYYLNFYGMFAINHYFEDIADNFGKFSYDEEKGDYYYQTSNLSSGGEDDIFRISFVNGKLAGTSLEFLYNGNARSWTTEYSRTGTVIVPDEIRKTAEKEVGIDT